MRAFPLCLSETDRQARRVGAFSDLMIDGHVPDKPGFTQYLSSCRDARKAEREALPVG